jgi:fimbrial chaperone protein
MSQPPVSRTIIRRAAIALALCHIAAPAAARAAAIVIWPIDPIIRPQEQATALWLENKGDTPVTMQVRALAWTQPTGDDRLDRQDDVVASPPIATVAPGARQLVRLIRRAPATAPERAFRLLIDELPPPPAITGNNAVEARLQVQMRYSIPLFVQGAADAAPPQLDARVAATGAGRQLLVHNGGAGHARLTDLRLIAADGRSVMLRAGLAGYVLPGATIAIPLAADQAGSVRVRVNGVDATLGNAV